MTNGRFGDCETVVDGWLGQPSNTLSSLGYIVAAVVVVIAVKRHGDRLIGFALAGALGLVGLGSFLFHGTGTRLGDLLHTVSIPLLLLSVVAAGFVSRGHAVQVALPPTILFAAGLAVYLISRTEGSLCDPDSILQGHAAWHLLSAAAAAWFGVRVVSRKLPQTRLSRGDPTS
jgi:hypothetical protein